MSSDPTPDTPQDDGSCGATFVDGHIYPYGDGYVRLVVPDDAKQAVAENGFPDDLHPEWIPQWFQRVEPDDLPAPTDPDDPDSYDDYDMSDKPATYRPFGYLFVSKAMALTWQIVAQTDDQDAADLDEAIRVALADSNISPQHRATMIDRLLEAAVEAGLLEPLWQRATELQRAREDTY